LFKIILINDGVIICYLSQNPNITWEIVQANPDKDWNYGFLSENPNITWDIIKANPDKGWSYFWLSANPNITWDIIQSNSDKDWKYYMLSKNPNITYEIIKENKDKDENKVWDFSILSQNKFEKHPFFNNYNYNNNNILTKSATKF